MKNRDLIELLARNGYYFERHGSNHDIYTNGKISEPVPRHSEIVDRLANKIIKDLDLK